MGGALGLAVLSTVAISGTTEILEGTGQSQPLEAVTEGFRSAFVVALAFPLLGFVAAMLLLGRRKGADQNAVQTSPITEGETSNEVWDVASDESTSRADAEGPHRQGDGDHR
jgi:hypothetical protein